MKLIDDFLNRTTMYRVVLYYLMVLWVVAFVFSVLGILPYTPVSMLLSLFILLVVSWAANYAFAYVFEVPANAESIYISVFILALIVTPALNPTEYIFLGWAGIIAMASKYIFAINHKHIFNPVAFSVAVTAFFLGEGASWWIDASVMIPFVFIGGLLVVRKLKRADLTLSFFVVALVSVLVFTFLRGGDVFSVFYRTFLYSPLLFFTFIMITEPLTTPPSRSLRILYGALVGFMFAPQVHIGTFYFTPELALLFGNVFSYLVSPKRRLILRLQRTIQITPDTAEFVFDSDYPIKFKPGQYLEFTLGHDKSDSRGNRRYFTIASSPTEKELRLGVKFYPEPSSFKKSLAYMTRGDKIIASQLSGDFVLPKDKNKKLVFIAGGIGITPFRSIIKYLIDTNQKRDIVIIYSNKKEQDIVYKDIFDQAKDYLNIKTVYTLTDIESVAGSWAGKKGTVDGRMIAEEVPDWENRTYYLSGPPSMITGIEKVIQDLGLSRRHIKTDFFPGFA